MKTKLLTVLVERAARRIRGRKGDPSIADDWLALMERAMDERVDSVALLRAYERLGRDDRATVLRALSHSLDFRWPWDDGGPAAVTASDIAALFRLIIGRPPADELEWRLHAGHIGWDIPQVVRLHLEQSKFIRGGALEPDQWRNEVRSVIYDGFEILAWPGDQVVSSGVLGGNYEPHITAVFRRLLKPGMMALDIGANIGYHTMLAASLVGPEGLVIAVEPHPDNAKMIEASRRLNRFEQVRVANVAAGEEIGLLSLRSHFSNAHTPQLPAGDKAIFAVRTIPCLPVGVLIPRDRKLDFVKIDVEGAEYRALSGMKEVLRRDRPVIVSEFTPDALVNISGIAPEGYLQFLIDLEYRLGVIGPGGDIAECGRNIGKVMQAACDSGWPLVDIVAYPEQGLEV